MKRLTRALLPLLAAFLFAGCLKDRLSHTYTILTPVYQNKQSVLENVKGQAAQPLDNPGKIYVYGNYLFVNEINKGVHVIDNSNPAHPLNKSFISIPGNVDIAVKGSILFADIYTDMLALDISDPLSAKITNVTRNVFSERSYGYGFIADTSQYIVGWDKRDTTVAYKEPDICRGCQIWFESSAFQSSSSQNQVTTGIAGSMTRFSIVDNYMYAVASSDLKVFDISIPKAPVNVKKQPLGSGIETIFPFKDKLFIGSQSGMMIFDISSPAAPAFVSNFTHARFCDPVITDGTFAYVTLRAGTACGTSPSSELNILDVTQLETPILVKSYPMQNPYGLGKVGNLLWICDGGAGLKLFDVTDPNAIQLKQVVFNIEPYDVIPLENTIIVSAKEGIFQYSYTSAGEMNQLSRL